ncbi:MAG: hypothetical protein R3C05_30680 [Pirellulaceae bacterium]
MPPRQNQAKQDSNAGMAGGLSVRIAAKAGAAYRNVGRDLVDSYAEDPNSLAKIPAEQLPASMRDMNPQQRVEYVREMSKRRSEIRQRIAKVSKSEPST